MAFSWLINGGDSETITTYESWDDILQVGPKVPTGFKFHCLEKWYLRNGENHPHIPEPRKKTRPYFPLNPGWFIGIFIIGLLWSRYNWVVFHPLYKPTGALFSLLTWRIDPQPSSSRWGCETAFGATSRATARRGGDDLKKLVRSEHMSLVTIPWLFVQDI